MADIDHKNDALADRYAKAILDLAERDQQSESVLEALQALVAQIEKDPAVDVALRSASIDPDTRERAIEKSCRGRMPDVLVNALQVMNRKGRMALLPVVAERYRLALEALRNEVDVHVTSAVPLTDALREQLRQAAAKYTDGRTPRLVERVDKALLGGVILQLEDRKYDGSLRWQLERLARRLHERAVHEIHRTTEHVEIGR
jgi:F-type H+-transporting ATPase subunit delta